MKRFFLLPLLCLVTYISGFSQNSYWEASYGLGVATYWGDLNTKSVVKNFTNVSPGGQIFVQYNKNAFIGFRSSLVVSKLKGDDNRATNIDQKRRNLSFFSPLVELNLMLEYNLFGFYPKDEEQKFSPTAFIGIAAFAFNPKTKYEGVTVNLQPLGTEGQGIEGFSSKYKRLQIGVPVGAGMKIKLKKTLSLGVEMIARYTLTDYIDDISTFYADFNTLEANNGILSAYLSERQDEFLGQPEGSFADSTNGTIRGGSSTNDYYITFMVSLRYNLGKKFTFKNKYKKGAHCPKF